MKRLATILITLLYGSLCFGQAPEKMSYQAIIRDATNTPISSSSVGMLISILQGSTEGLPIYVELHTPTTNTNGLISLEIGNGIIVIGEFSEIDWGNGPYYIKTETDTNGGTDYSLIGTSQLISVPYALYAKTSSCLTVGTTEVFNGTSSTDWTTLDLSSVVGSNYANLTLKVTELSGVSGVGVLAIFRQNGDIDDYQIGAATNNMVSIGPLGVGQALIYTDGNGIIEWKSNRATRVKIEVVAFTK